MAGIHGGGRKAVLTYGKDGPGSELWLREFERDGSPTGVELRVVMDDRGIVLPPGEGDPPPDEDPQRRILAAIRKSDLRVYDLLLPTDPQADDPSEETLAKFADALVAADGFSGLSDDIPAAYTYLGQIVAHDISHTLISESGRASSLLPGSLNFDSLLGREGAARPSLPGGLLEVGTVALGQTLMDGQVLGGYDDLPRWTDGKPAIPDPRNDAMLNLSQLHVLLTKFIMAAEGELSALDPTARRRVIVQHLQSVIYHDYLERLLPPCLLADIETHGRRLIGTSVRGGTSGFYAPLEFSWGCFQVGHSMIRENYAPWGRSDVANPPQSAFIRTLLNFSGNGPGLPGGRLPDNWRAEWQDMLGQRGGPVPVPVPVPAVRFGAQLRRDVYTLPGRLFDVVEGQPKPDYMNLALRTMAVARRLRVPHGQALAAFAAAQGVVVPTLSPADLAGGLPTEALAAFQLQENGRVSLAERTPLWFYSLREAERGGGTRFGPLAGRIVGETIHAAIAASGSGFLDPQGRPVFSGNAGLPAHQPGRFDLYDLRAIAEA